MHSTGAWTHPSIYLNEVCPSEISDFFSESIFCHNCNLHNQTGNHKCNPRPTQAISPTLYLHANVIDKQYSAFERVYVCVRVCVCLSLSLCGRGQNAVEVDESGADVQMIIAPVINRT